MSQLPANQSITQLVYNSPTGLKRATYNGSLLDRLSSVEPEDVAASTLARGEMRLSDVKTSVLRELNWLFNTTQLETSVDLSNWSAVRRSVLNYGVPSLVGRWQHLPERTKLERQLASIVECFEPRIRKGSAVITTTREESSEDPHAFILQLDAECQFERRSLPLRIQARLDGETGQLYRFTEA